MAKIATLEDVGRSIGVSKQMIIKYLNKKSIRKNKQGKIDIEDERNNLFLQSKLCDFSVFYGDNIPENVKSVDRKRMDFSKKAEKKPEKVEKVIQKPVKIESKPAEIEQIKPKSKTKEPDNSENSFYEAELKLKLESIKAKQLDSQLKKIKIEEQHGRLIDRSLCEKLINDSLGAIVQAFITLPSSVVDMILTIYENHPTDRREQIIKLLQEKYTKESKKIIDRAFQKHRKAIKEQIEQAENETES